MIITHKYSENEFLERLQLKPRKRHRSSDVKRLPKPNPDSTHSPDPPPKYYKIGEVVYYEKKSNALEAIERDKKDKREKTDNQLSPILSKGELLITGSTGNYQILQPEKNEEKNPHDCEASMLEAAKMRASVKCRQCNKSFAHSGSLKTHQNVPIQKSGRRVQLVPIQKSGRRVQTSRFKNQDEGSKRPDSKIRTKGATRPDSKIGTKGATRPDSKIGTKGANVPIQKSGRRVQLVDEGANVDEAAKSGRRLQLVPIGTKGATRPDC